MKKIKMLMTAILSVVVLGAMSGVSAAAQNITIGDTPANHEFTITRTIEGVSNPVSNTFTYTITAAGTNPSGATGMPTSATVTFNNKAPVSNVATETGTIDLSNVTFTTNGDYEWTVTESATGDSTNYPLDSTDVYKIKVSVRNSASTNLTSNQGKTVTIFGYDKDGNKIGDPTSADPAKQEANFPFTSQAQYRHIEIKKTVTGNMADVDLCFDVEVTVGTTGQTYAVSGGCNNAATIPGGTATTLSLKHNDTIIIGKSGTTEQIPIGVNYSFTEQGATAYTTTINGAQQPSKTSGTQTVSSTASANVNTIVNHYENATITGAFMKILPYVIIAVIAIAGVIYMIVRNKKNKKVEE